MDGTLPSILFYDIITLWGGFRKDSLWPGGSWTMTFYDPQENFGP